MSSERDRAVIETESILYRVANHVATLTINRPDRRNSLSSDALEGLLRGFEQSKHDPDVHVVVVTGTGDRAFCAGADLTGFVPHSAVEDHLFRGKLAELFRAAYGLGKPTIAKVRGYALAGGFGVALMCDLVIASDDAVFGTPEIDVGMWPMLITVPMLRSMPAKVALDLQMSGRRVSAAEGQQLGFVSRVTPPAELDDVVAEVATALAAKPASILRLGRDAFYRVVDQQGDDALALLHAALALVLQTEDHQEGIVAFLEKRAPRWTGR